MKTTYHSEYGQLKSIYLKHVSASFIGQQRISEQWNQLNYLAQPNFNKALKEYAAFEDIIISTDAEINYFPTNSSVMMDSIYCRDASIATDFGIILCTMGKEERKNEPNAAQLMFAENNEKILGSIETPGTVEGGDVAWIDQNTLAVGRTYRTNDEGIRQLKSLLNPNGIEVIIVDLPHYKGPTDVFHLMSILSPIDKDLAVIYSPLMPISFRELLLNKSYKLVEVPEEEFESMGCNVLATSPRKCLMVDGNLITKKRLEDAGAKVTVYTGEEISVKGGGGPTCLTRPMRREI